MRVGQTRCRHENRPQADVGVIIDAVNLTPNINGEEVKKWPFMLHIPIKAVILTPISHQPGAKYKSTGKQILHKKLPSPWRLPLGRHSHTSVPHTGVNWMSSGDGHRQFMRLSILKMSLMWLGLLSGSWLTVANWEWGSLPACLLTTNMAGICECRADEGLNLN